MPTDDEACQLGVGGGDGGIAEKKSKLGDEVGSTILQWRRREQEHASVNAERRDDIVTFRARIPQMVRLVDDQKIGNLDGHTRTATQPLE
jgi:hypothetical protein